MVTHHSLSGLNISVTLLWPLSVLSCLTKNETVKGILLQKQFSNSLAMKKNKSKIKSLRYKTYTFLQLKSTEDWKRSSQLQAQVTLQLPTLICGRFQQTDSSPSQGTKRIYARSPDPTTKNKQTNKQQPFPRTQHENNGLTLTL